jgi:hypothetical protein
MAEIQNRPGKSGLVFDGMEVGARHMIPEFPPFSKKTHLSSIKDAFFSKMAEIQVSYGVHRLPFRQKLILISQAYTRYRTLIERAVLVLAEDSTDPW